ncbi:MAG TPA: hypothetical protein DDZ88_22745 [Verrucomicrobiales bacterium]|nr:hypothetical protein [Verrucomicrobiales bacterium]
MKWLALTFGGESCASTHFRVHQYVPMLREMGVELVCKPAAELDRVSSFVGFNGVLLQKKLLGAARRRKIVRSGLPVIFDIDDATWHPLETRHHFITRWRTAHRLKASLKLSKLALPANHFIASHLRQLHPRVEVLPMTLPLAAWKSALLPQGPVVLGWAGAPGNHFQLRSIEAALREVKRVMPEVVIRIFSGTRPEIDVEIDFVPFDAARQTEILHSFSIGLMPLPDTSFNHGKSPIKALQYMAAGIPCVAAALSGTVELLGQDCGALYAADTASWSEKLLHLARDSAMRETMGRLARARFEAEYTAERAVKRLADHFHELAS